MRLDIFLVEHKFYETRNKAQNAIKNNLILVNGKVINKYNYFAKNTDLITKIETDEYVSRGAYKLLEAIKHWNINFTNKVVLDIGSSTGGFSEVSIKSGAKLVYAVDVGTNQLHEKLLNNKKIISIENTHFKNLSIDMFKQPIDIVVADISFISLTKLFDKLTTLLNYKYLCVFLIKPQFELSPQEVNSGKVKSKKLLDKAINKIKSYAILNSFKVNGVIPSPILGSKSENKEFLIYMEKQ